MGYIYRPKDKRTLYNEKSRGINIWNAQLFIYIQTNDTSRPGYTTFVQLLVQQDVASHTTGSVFHDQDGGYRSACLRVRYILVIW